MVPSRHLRCVWDTSVSVTVAGGDLVLTGVVVVGVVVPAAGAIVMSAVVLVVLASVSELDTATV